MYHSIAISDENSLDSFMWHHSKKHNKFVTAFSNMACTGVSSDRSDTVPSQQCGFQKISFLPSERIASHLSRFYAVDCHSSSEVWKLLKLRFNASSKYNCQSGLLANGHLLVFVCDTTNRGSAFTRFKIVIPVTSQNLV